MAEVVRVAQGVWRPAEAAEDFAGRCAALLSACPEGAVIAGVAAARLHRFWLPDLDDRPIDVILRRDAEVPRRHAGSRRREIRGRRRTLIPDEIVVVAGLPVTSEARTWLDLAETLSTADLIAAGDSALREGTTPAEIAIVLTRAFHRRGVVRARAALDLLDARSRSRPESHLRYALVSSGLPTPEVNKAIFTGAGEWLAEPDLHYDEARLALEYNGAEHAQPTRMRRDLTRDVDIQHRGGWRIVTFGPAEVFSRPEQTAAFVRELLRERAPQLLRRPA
jgi:hypothetical protein